MPLKPTMGALRVLCAHMTNTNWKGEKLDTYLPQVRMFFFNSSCMVHTHYKSNAMKLYTRNRRVGPNGNAKFNWSVDGDWRGGVSGFRLRPPSHSASCHILSGPGSVGQCWAIGTQNQQPQSVRRRPHSAGTCGWHVRSLSRTSEFSLSRLPQTTFCILKLVHVHLVFCHLMAWRLCRYL